MTKRHALVFGASGITGWAIFRLLRTYPTEDTWSRITGLTNRPLTLSEAQVPASEQSTGRTKLVSGVDLKQPVSMVAQALRDKIGDINSVTHVFFAAFIKGADYAEDKKINVEILRNAIDAVEELCPALEMVVLQTGGKHYGVEFGPELVPDLKRMPYEEERPRIKGEVGDLVFYYAQVDTLTELSKGKGWQFAEVRPDIIVGLVPSSSGSVSGQDASRGLALYLALWRKVYGEGSTVPFPGDEEAWTCRQNDSFQDGIARVAIFVSLYRDKYANRIQNGEAFNAVDGPTTTWEKKWPKLCAWFGLKGVGPEARDGGKGLKEALPMEEMTAWIEEHKPQAREMVKENELNGDAWEGYKWVILWYMIVAYKWSREYDMRKLRRMDFDWEIDSSDGWLQTFERFKEAKIIP